MSLITISLGWQLISHHQLVEPTTKGGGKHVRIDLTVRLGGPGLPGHQSGDPPRILTRLRLVVAALRGGRVLANPVQSSAHDPDLGRRVAVMIRCGNRRAAICPSCSDLYAADTWQLIHAGAQGGHHGMPETTANRPQVFATLTAPSFGAVHTSSGRPGRADTVCHPPSSGKSHCPHGKALRCNVIHAGDDPEVGQPLCPDCYD